MTKKLDPFVKWKREAQRHADRLDVVAGDDLWDDVDSFDLAEAAEAAFQNGESAKDFVERVFAEDLASQAHDNMMAEEALGHEFAEEGAWE